MDNGLAVLVSTSVPKAKIISSRLEQLGVECYYKSTELSDEQNESQVNIYVNSKDLEKANEILKGFTIDIPGFNKSVEEFKIGGLILIPVDFTQASANAMYVALELASKFNSKIKMIHTYGLPEIRPISFDDTDFYTGTLTAHMAEMRSEAEKKFEELMNHVTEYVKKHQLKDLEISSAIINGLPDEITLYTAETENASFIVMGISRKDVRTFEPVGKMASHVVEKAKCPVLIIPEDYNFVRLDHLKQVLYPTAFDETDFISIQQLLKIITSLNANIHLLHISNTENNPWDSIKMDGLRDYFQKAYKISNVSCELIVSNEVLDALDEHIMKKNIDLIAIVTHKRNFIWKMINPPSLTLKILYHTRIPLLVFHS